MILAAVLGAPFIVATIVAAVVGRASFVAATIVARLTVVLGMAGDARHRWLITHARIDRLAVGIIARLAELIEMTHALAVCVGQFAAVLQHLLLTVGDDHAIVVLGVLEIVLRENRVAGCLGISRQRHVLAGYVRRSAADLNVRTIGFKTTG